MDNRLCTQSDLQLFVHRKSALTGAAHQPLTQPDKQVSVSPEQVLNMLKAPGRQ